MEETPEAEFRREFADFLNARRTARGWSKAGLAKAGGLSNGAANPILGARGVPASYRSINLLLKALQVDREQVTYWQERRRLLDVPKNADASNTTKVLPTDTSEAKPDTQEVELQPNGIDAEAAPSALTDERFTTRGRRRRPSRRLWVGILVVTLLATIGLVWLSSTREVNGKVRCLSGAPVAGVWTRSGGRGRPADVRPASDGWFTYNGRALTFGWYELHVGCGYLPNGRDWKVVAYSSPRLNAQNLVVECDDSSTVTSTSPYRGRCSTR